MTFNFPIKFYGLFFHYSIEQSLFCLYLILFYFTSLDWPTPSTTQRPTNLSTCILIVFIGFNVPIFFFQTQKYFIHFIKVKPVGHAARESVLRWFWLFQSYTDRVGDSLLVSWSDSLGMVLARHRRYFASWMDKSNQCSVD